MANIAAIETPEGGATVPKEMYLYLLDRHNEGREELKHCHELIDNLEGQLDESQRRINELIDKVNEMKHEDEVIITTKHKIRSIDLYFEEGGQ